MAQSYAINRPTINQSQISDDHIIEIHNSRFIANGSGTRGPQTAVFRMSVAEFRKAIVEGSVSESTVYVDAVNGSDETGTLGSKANAFKTIREARNAATANWPGSLIHVLKGVYTEEHNLTYDGTYYFEPDTHIHAPSDMSDSGGTRYDMFLINDTPLNPPYRTAVLPNPKMNVLGYGNFYVTKATDIATGGWTTYLIGVYNETDDNRVYFECNTIHTAPSGGAIRAGAGNFSVRIREGIYGINYSEHPSNGAGTILVQTGQIPASSFTLDMKCPLMRTAGRAFDFDQTLTDTIASIDVGLIETYSDAAGDATLQMQPSHDLDGGKYTINIDTIVNLKSRAMFWVDCEAGKWMIDIKRVECESEVSYFLARANIAATDLLQVNLKVGQGISNAAAPIHMYNLQDDAKYFIEGVYRTLADDKYCVRLDKNAAGALVQLDGTYINEGTDPAAHAIFMDAGEEPVILGNVQLHSTVASIAAGALTVLPIRGSVWMENDVTSDIYVPGIYMVGLDTKMPGGGDVVKTVTVPISSANILALHSTPIELVAAPGAGKALIPISAYIKYTYATFGYGGGDPLKIGLATADEASLLNTGVLGAVTNVVQTFYPNDAVGAASEIVENQAMNLSCTVAYTDGNGNAEMVVSYKEIKLSI